MIQDFAAYPEWKAPAEDSQFLIWPEPLRILADTQENHERLTKWDSPMAELRRRQREMLKLSQDRPAIATGHQTELFHTGVWAKLAMIEAASRKIDADMLFAAVDGDAPKHLQFRFPGWSWPITDDPRVTSAPWCGILQAPSAPHLKHLKQALEHAAVKWSFKPMAREFLDDLRQQSEHSAGLSEALVAAMYRLDWELGLRHQSLITSRLWMNEPYLAFVYHLLSHAGDFAREYNRALKEYREAHGIDNPGRPMPDLAVAEDCREAPFWLDDLNQNTRKRAGVRRQGSDWVLSGGGQTLALREDDDLLTGASKLREFLHAQNLRLSPRALTLTMFLRLLVVDQFVHGIGGGRYEQVNDRVIQRFFGIDPPAFCVTTATLYFPEAVGRERACIPCLAHEGHHLRHRVLGPEKMEMVKEIASLPRRSLQRQRIFSRMHSRLAEVVQVHPSVSRWQERMEEVTKRNAEEAGMFDRELFYGIQPRERLEGLMDRYREGFE
jgi:hypothetical protein